MRGGWTQPEQSDSIGRRGGWPASAGRMAWVAIWMPMMLFGCGEFLAEPDAALVSLKGAGRTRIAEEADLALAATVSLAADGDHVLLDLGRSEAGDEWWIVAEGDAGDARRVVLALLDADESLLVRERLSTDVPVRHIVRRSTEHLYAAVMSTTAEPLALTLVAGLWRGRTVPAPQPQVVWLNFDGGRDVRICDCTAMSFSPFDAAVLGGPYAGSTSLIKDEIVRVMREVYADYNVVIWGSHERAKPEGPCSVVHFGGDDERHLGMGHHVDRYNQEPDDEAIVYVEAFAAYATMELTPGEMGRMLGTVASHELGHLLGLYHTCGTANLMDSSRTAWDLVGPSDFGAAPLAQSVFVLGQEDADALLAQTVGCREGLAVARAAD